MDSADAYQELGENGKLFHSGKRRGSNKVDRTRRRAFPEKSNRHHTGLAMNLKDWEATIQQIADEFSLAPTEAGQQKVLAGWRAKLEKEPTSLPAFRVDQIVREVRARGCAVSR
jgi:hypothetical protein